MADKPRKKNILPKPGQPGKKPNNQLWIFISLIIVFFAISFLTNTNTGIPITPSRFEEMVKSNDVAKIVFITNQRSVEVTLKQEALQNAKYKTELENNSLFGAAAGPHYVMRDFYSSADKFDEYYNEFIGCKIHAKHVK